MAAFNTPLYSSHDQNLCLNGSHMLPDYIAPDDSSYNYDSPQPDNGQPVYPTFEAPFLPSQDFSDCSQKTVSMAAQYPYGTALLPNSQRRMLQNGAYPYPRLTQSPASHGMQLSSSHDCYQLGEVEGQESRNEKTMLSEAVHPPMDGFPDIVEFDKLIKGYVEGLSSKKQDKALIHAARAKNIRAVLVDKKTTQVESAQFRFWVKKMFTLNVDSNHPERRKQICHEGKPVAIREKLYKILVKAHKQCQHGGRDKTSSQVRRVYSWVPKELISRFVKLCPTCRARRGSTSSNMITPVSPKASSAYLPPNSPEPLSPPSSRRESFLSHRSPAYPPSSATSTMFSDQYPGQPWMSTNHRLQSSVGRSSPHTPMHSPTGHYDQQSMPMTSYGLQGGVSHRSYAGSYEAGPLSSTSTYY